MLHSLARGAAAGAAGTTALNAVTYIDMALRGRPSSSTPQRTVEKLAEAADVDIPGDEDTRSNRLQGLGPLTGMAAGVGSGVAYAVLRRLGWRPGLVAGTAFTTVSAILMSNGPMTALGITDPREWSASQWAADLVPHLAYGWVTARTVEALEHV